MMNIPNFLTMFRLGMIPVIFFGSYLSHPYDAVLPATVFIIASLTDFFDGYFARLLKQHSSFGSMLDPIADKMIIVTALVVVIKNGTLAGVDVMVAMIIIWREILITSLRAICARYGIGLPSSRFAKSKTVVQIVALCLLMLSEIDNPMLLGTLLSTLSLHTLTLHSAGLIVLWVAGLFTVMSAWSYFRIAIPKIRQANQKGSSSFKKNTPRARNKQKRKT